MSSNDNTQRQLQIKHFMMFKIWGKYSFDSPLTLLLQHCKEYLYTSPVLIPVQPLKALLLVAWLGWTESAYRWRSWQFFPPSLAYLEIKIYKISIFQEFYVIKFIPSPVSNFLGKLSLPCQTWCFASATNITFQSKEVWNSSSRINFTIKSKQTSILLLRVIHKGHICH